MNAERVTYLDSSAIVKLVAEEPESAALRHYLRRRHRLASSALARTEVARALMEDGPAAVRRGWEVLQAVSLIRISDHVLILAGELLPAELRSLDAIHLATAQLLAQDFGSIVTYDARMTVVARAMRMRVVSPR
jgi:predicted nucleic acid-binding protein